MSTVYVVQEAPGRNYSPATRWADNVRICLPQFKSTMDPVDLFDTFTEKLRDFGMNDFLILTGAPVAMVIAAVVAGRKTNGSVNILVWDKQTTQYFPLRLNLNHKG